MHWCVQACCACIGAFQFWRELLLQYSIHCWSNFQYYYFFVTWNNDNAILFQEAHKEVQIVAWQKIALYFHLARISFAGLGVIACG